MATPVTASTIPGKTEIHHAVVKNGRPPVIIAPHSGVSAGIAEIMNNRVKIFVLSAERPEDIDINRAKEAKELAEERIRQKHSQQEYLLSQLAVQRAMSRLSAASKYRSLK